MELFPIGTVVARRYRVLSELGRGGMGVVYLVEHVHTGQELALKVLSFSAGLTAAAIERFKREARAAARIRGEHVVTVTDADVLPELGGMPFFVMERLRGRDLEAEVVRRGKLPPREVVELLTQAARTLGDEEIRLTKRNYQWPEDAKFLVPPEVRAHFAAGVGAKDGSEESRFRSVLVTILADRTRNTPVRLLA